MAGGTNHFDERFCFRACDGLCSNADELHPGRFLSIETQKMFMSLLLVAIVVTFKHLHHFKLYSCPECCFPPRSLQTGYSLSLVTLVISHILLEMYFRCFFHGLFCKYPGKPDRACLFGLFSPTNPMSQF